VKRGLLTATLTGALALAGCGQKPASVQVTPAKVMIYGLKKGVALNAQVLDKKGRKIDGQVVEWKTDKADIASVEPSGFVQSKNAGKTTVRASLGPLSGTTLVEVLDTQSILVTPGRVTLAGPRGSLAYFNAEVKDAKGKTVTQFRPKWVSNDPKVASVDQNGIATSIGEGKALISAVLGDLEGAAEINVLFREIGSVEIAPTTVILGAKESSLLRTVVRDDKGVEIQNASLVWTSSDPAAVKVFGGLVTGLTPGSATVKGTCGSKSAEVTVLVN